MRSKFVLLVGALALFGVRSVSAQIVYDNFTTDTGYYLDENMPAQPGNPNPENGDQITLSTAAPTTIGSFTFEYFIDPLLYLGTENVRIRFYDLDGGPISQIDPTPTPGSVLYDTTLSLTESGRVRRTLDNLNVTVPGTFVWSVQFGGGNFNNQLAVGGVTLYSPPTVGSNFPDFWQNFGTGWDVYHFEPGPPADFSATFTAVPEPAATATVMLLTAAGLVWWRKVAARRDRAGQVS